MLDQAPDSAEALLLAGRAAGKAGRMDEALAHFARLPNDDSPTVVEGTNLHGELLMHLGRLSEAEQQFLRALRKDPQSYFAHHRLAYLYSLVGRYWNAVPELLFLVRSEKFNQHELELLSGLQVSTAEEKDLLRYKEAAPDDAAVGLGWALFNRDDLPVAEEQLAQSDSIRPAPGRRARLAGLGAGASAERGGRGGVERERCQRRRSVTLWSGWRGPDCTFAGQQAGPHSAATGRPCGTIPTRAPPTPNLPLLESEGRAEDAALQGARGVARRSSSTTSAPWINGATRGPHTFALPNGWKRWEETGKPSAGAGWRKATRQQTAKSAPPWTGCKSACRWTWCKPRKRASPRKMWISPVTRCQCGGLVQRRGDRGRRWRGADQTDRSGERGGD